MSILDEEMKKWFKNGEAISKYREGIDALEDSKLFPILQRMGIPNRHLNIDTAALDASWSNGYQTALEHLRHFIHLFETKVVTPIEPPDFGGFEQALKSGDLRKEDFS